MIELHQSTLTKLRDQMWGAAAKLDEAVLSSAGGMLAEVGLYTEEERRALTVMGPVLEVLFLMMAADGDLHPNERAVIFGAASHLSNGFLGRDTMDVVLRHYESLLVDQGWDARLKAATEALQESVDLAETAFALAGAVALADERVDPREDGVLDMLGELLGIDEERAHGLFAALERDWSSQE